MTAIMENVKKWLSSPYFGGHERQTAYIHNELVQLRALWKHREAHYGY